jgi:heterodisulfide reductase subunit C
LARSDIIWTCATCLRCVQRCPQKASPYHVLMTLRNLAAEREAKVPEGYLKAVSQILETGLAEALQSVVTKKMESFDRESLKLPKINSPQEGFQSAFMKIMEEKRR